MVEILVTMTIIVILIGLLVVAAGGARSAAIGATTQSRLNALSQAATRFEADTGYLPPLLDNDRASIDGIEPSRTMSAGRPAYLTVAQRRYSYTSPAEYLLGYGDAAQDGHDGLGIHRPGDDGYWRASLNDSAPLGRYELAERKPQRSGQLGQVLGPYVDLDDPDMLGAIGWDNGAWDGSIDPATNQPVVYYPGDSGYHDDAPKVIVDGWGTPIRYYRINHPPLDPTNEYLPDYEPEDGWRYRPSLAEHFVLRPWEFDDAESTVWWFTDASGQKWGDYSSEGGSVGNGDPSIPRSLTTARFAFVSAGPNRRIYDWARVDFPGEALGGLSDARGDHADADSAGSGWYSGGQDLQWLGKPAFDAGVLRTEEANRDNIIEVGK